MNVGFVGLGKLGLPVAYSIASRGLNVLGYDPAVTGPPTDTSHEHGLDDIIEQAGERLTFTNLFDIVQQCNTIFVAVQTPHSPQFEGITPLPDERADFDYSHLREAVGSIDQAAFALGRHDEITIVVISTVLPGTMRREILPVMPAIGRLVYNPSFIAMGTTIRDFLDPEFILLGGDEDGTVEGVYRRIYGLDMPRIARTSVDNAELVKVAYNTFIGLKIAFANTLMEVCHKTGCDVDEVTGALKLAHRRLISPAYLDGGMGDGGGCHPRDNIALSWLAGELDLSYDLFGAAMECREAQAGWLCELMEDYDMPMGIAGTEYKPGSALKTGSPALLVKHLLEGRGHTVDVFPFDDRPRVVLIGCKHPEFEHVPWPAGSVVIDPFRYIPDQPGVQVVRIGEWAPAHTATSSSTTRAQAA